MNPSHPILSNQESLAYEQALLGEDQAQVRKAMTRAGRMLGQAVMRDFREIAPMPERVRVLVLAGKGHNAGDALIAADEILRFHPYGEVHVLFVFGEEALGELVAQAWENLQNIGKTLSYSTAQVGEIEQQAFDVCLDGVFGMQFKPPLRGELPEVFLRINAHPRIRMRAAVDLPSGVGEGLDESAFRADMTYATGIAKFPVFVEAHRKHVGRVRYLDIGFFDEESRVPSGRETQARVLLPDILKPLQQLREASAHKYRYGHLCVVAGSRTMPGAALMVVQAALRSGVGLVTACVPESLQAVMAAQAPQAMWLPLPETASGNISEDAKAAVLDKLSGADALLMGPGMGREEETQTFMAEVLKNSDTPFVLDADALMPSVIQARERPKHGCLTPHDGEFQRLSGSERPHTDAGLMRFAGETSLSVLLKGSLTRMSDGQHLYYSPYGNPVLARGGSGDVLAGLVGGLLAQIPERPLEVLSKAAVWHGLAADALARAQGQHSAVATDLIQFLPAVLRDYEC